MGGQRGDTEGHAVGGAGHFGHADGAAGSGLVFNHHGLAAQQLDQHVLHVAGHHVGGAAGRKGTTMRRGREVSCAMLMPEKEEAAAAAAAV